jgi:hypothetical protein
MKRSKTKRRRKTKFAPGGGIIGPRVFEFDSPAFQQLSADATRIYLFMRRRCDFDGANNGRVIFSHRDAAKALNTTGWRRSSNAIAELIHFGFIKWRNHGDQGAQIRLAAEWQLTAFPCGGQPEAKTFMHWDGVLFEPPFSSRQKQLPTVKTTTPRRQNDDAPPQIQSRRSRQRGKPSAKRRRFGQGGVGIMTTLRILPPRGAPLSARLTARHHQRSDPGTLRPMSS